MRDAQSLAAFGHAMAPAPTTPHDPALTQLDELLALRSCLRDQRAANRQRLDDFDLPALRARLKRLIRSLETHIQALDEDIKRLIAHNPVLRAKVQCLTQTQGVGTLSAAALLAAMPELGELNRTQAAALAGLAPFAKDSGNFPGKRRIQAGRSRARNALYMPALVASKHNPVLAPIYQRLIANAKPPKLALTALMRKLLSHLNAQIRNLNLNYS